MKTVVSDLKFWRFFRQKNCHDVLDSRKHQGLPAPSRLFRPRPIDCDSGRDRQMEIFLLFLFQHRKKSFSFRARYLQSQPGRLIHLEIAGPLLESRIGRYRYLMVMLLIDDSTRFWVAVSMRSREEASAKIRGFVSRFNALWQAPQGVASRASAPFYVMGPRSSCPTKSRSTSTTTGRTRRRAPQGFML